MSLDDSMNDQLLLAQVKEKLRKQFNQLELDDGKNKFCPKSIKIGWFSNIFHFLQLFIFYTNFINYQVNYNKTES